MISPRRQSSYRHNIIWKRYLTTSATYLFRPLSPFETTLPTIFCESSDSIDTGCVLGTTALWDYIDLLHAIPMAAPWAIPAPAPLSAVGGFATGVSSGPDTRTVKARVDRTTDVRGEVWDTDWDEEFAKTAVLATLFVCK